MKIDPQLRELDTKLANMYLAANGALDYLKWLSFLEELSSIDTEPARNLKHAFVLVERAFDNVMANNGG